MTPPVFVPPSFRAIPFLKTVHGFTLKTYLATVLNPSTYSPSPKCIYTLSIQKQKYPQDKTNKQLIHLPLHLGEVGSFQG
jgi:hypothetical protein